MVYTWDPKDYKKHSVTQKGFADELLAKLDFRGDERVLDIGCGDGKISASLANLVPNGSVVGIDSSPSMVDFAREAFPLTEYPNLEFLLADAARMFFADEFDVAFSTAALHWVINHAPVLAGLYGSLKPGGRFLLQMGGKGNAGEVIAAAEGIINTPEWRDYFTAFPFPYGFYAPDEYREWSEQAGLVVDRAELVPKDVRHSDRSAFEGWFRTTWLPYLDRVPEARRDDFIAKVIDAYLAENPSEADGSILVKMVRLEIAGRKPPQSAS